MEKTHSNMAYIYLLITFSLWGSLYVVSRYVLDLLPTFSISFFRFLLAFGFLMLMDLRSQTGTERDTLKREHIPYILLIGGGGYFIAVGAQLLGTKFAGASMASLINSMNPLTMSVFGAIVLGEKLTRRNYTGILLSLLGVIAVFGGSLSEVSIPGILLSLFSVLFWSYVSVMTRKITRLYRPLYISKLACGTAALCYLPVAVAEASIQKTPVFHTLIHEPLCTAALVYMGIVCTGAAYMLWNKSLSMKPAGTCSSFYPLQPVVSTLLGVLLLGETVSTGFIAGGILIVCGVLVSMGAFRI